MTSRRRGSTRAWRRLRAAILRRDPICCICGLAPSTQVDHIVPVSEGGTNDPGNLRGTCKPCNLGRRDRAFYPG